MTEETIAGAADTTTATFEDTVLAYAQALLAADDIADFPLEVVRTFSHFCKAVMADSQAE